MAESIKARAIVSHGPNVHDDWKLEEVSTLPDVKDDEILVEMVASGAPILSLPTPPPH